MPDYSKAKIYKIYSYENDEVYYGSTCNTLSRRMANHRSDFKIYKDGKCGYITSFQIIKLTSAKIELVENFPCNSKEELLQREGYYIKNNNCINKYIPDRTKKEYDIMYRESNKDKIKEQNKKYKEQNKDKINEYRKVNKDKIKEYNKQYYQQKKEQQLLNIQDTNINEI